METKLDDIANGDMERVEMLREFYGPFDAALDHAFQNAQRVRRAEFDVASGIKCEGGTELVVRNGRRGEFLACPEFPKCRVALDLKPSDESEIPEWDEKKNQRMQRCFKEHPEAAKRRTTRSSRSRSRTSTGRTRTSR